MRVRTAKKLAQRIDLYYFRRARGLRRWRLVLSAALPLAALLWISVFAAAGSRQPFSAGPVSSAHAFAELRCEVCHTGGGSRTPGDPRAFRAHTTDAACTTCHDAPAHAANMTPAPACAACHEEHRGRVRLASTSDGFCTGCHTGLQTTHGEPGIAKNVGSFPGGHPEFAAARPGARDAARIRFNHAVHMKDGVRGPNGPETLACSTCHTPELSRPRPGAKRVAATGLMAPVAYAENCARCHPLFFDERIEQPVPHVEPGPVRAFVQRALADYIAAHPGDISSPDTAVRRVPLNFPRPPEPPARNAGEWVARRAAADERLLWNKTCVECHEPASARAAAGQAGTTGPEGPLPAYAPTNVPAQWMPRAAFDHAPHGMIRCASCHAAEGSTKTSDVLMPNQAACASCHTASKGGLRPGAGQAESRCFECHRYHDWTKSHPVTPSYSLTDFK